MSESIAKMDLCPKCGNTTDSLKQFEFPRLVFFLLGASYHIDRVTACPVCLRNYLFRWSAISVLTANLLWPVIVFPLFISRLFASFLPGCSGQKKSTGKKIAGAVIGLFLVIAAFTLFVAMVGTFGPFPRPWFITAIIAIIVICLFGLLGAFADL